MFLKSISKTIVSIMLVVLVVLCMAFQNQISMSVYDSLVRCVTKIIPSLFAMTVLSSVIQRSGIIDKVFSKLSVDTTALSCFIFGNLGGYPIGAKLVSDAVLSRKLNKSIAEEVMPFSFSCGPAFAIGISYAIYNSSACGFVAFASIALSNLIMYLVYAFKHRVPKNHQSNIKFSTAIVVESVSNAAWAMINISAMIAAFSVIISLLECIFPSIFISFLPSLFEISRVTELRSPSPVMLTLLLSFGGLCVHMQIISLVNEAFSLKKFFVTRLVQIPLSATFALVFNYIFNLNSLTVSSPSYHISQSNSIVPLICMLAMLVIVFMHKRKRRTA